MERNSLQLEIIDLDQKITEAQLVLKVLYKRLYLVMRSYNDYIADEFGILSDDVKRQHTKIKLYDNQLQILQILYNELN